MRTRRHRDTSPEMETGIGVQTEPVEKNDMTEVYENLRSIPSFSSKIAEFLKQNETHSLHRRIVRRRYPTRRIITHYPFQIFMADLIEYTQPGYRHANGGYKYILLVIDCFSKYVWTVPMKKKDKQSSAEAMDKILSNLDNHPNTIITDEGLEFYNNAINQIYEKYGILHYSIKTARKASIAERAIQTIKNRYEKYFYKNKTKEWIDVLPEMTRNYNQTPHRSIGLAPSSVTFHNREAVFKRQFPKIDLHKTPRLKKGDIVRLLEKKKLFDKGYKRSWSKELYTIESSHQKSGIVWYHLKDQNGKVSTKTRYYWELNKVL